MKRLSIQTLCAAALAACSWCSFADTNNYVGSDQQWNVADNWSLGRVPTADDDVTVVGKTVTCEQAVSVKSLTLTGKAAVTFRNASKTTGVSVTDWQASAALLWDGRMTVTVSGKLTVGTGATLYSACEPETGSIVVFTCGELEVAEGGKISAEKLGYQWIQHTADTAPDNTYSDNTGGKKFYTYAYGHGQNFGNAGGYGGAGNNTSYGKVYGYRAAPFMSGSQVGTYNGNVDIAATGSIVLFVSGAADIQGVITATSPQSTRGHGSNSGGGIWLAAKTIAIGATGSVQAKGGLCGAGYDSPAGGGRIAICIGLTDSELESMAGGAEPSDLTYVDAYGCDCSAMGGVGKGGTGKTGNAGTALVIYRASDTDILGVSGAPANFGAPVPAYGFHAVEKGTVPTVVAPEAPIPEGWRNRCRYASVRQEKIAGAQPQIVWHAEGEQYLQKVRILGQGSVTTVSGTQTTDFEIWKTAGEALSLTAGSDFVGWYGDIPGGSNAQTTVTLTTDLPADIFAVFADATGVARTYSGAANGFTDEAENWTPAGVPGPLDDVTVPSGKSVRALNALAVKSLTVCGSLALGGMTANATTEQVMTDYAGGFSGLLVEQDLSVTGKLTLGSRTQTTPVVASSVGGNVTLSGAGTLAVYAGENDASMSVPFAGVYAARLVFAIGGNLTLSDTSILYPVADQRTGTPIQWLVDGDVSLGASAKVMARNLGFNWTFTNDPRCNSAISTSWGVVYSMAPGLPKNTSGHTIRGCYGGGTMPYGSPYAPFMPGSQCSIYNSQKPNAGGGSAWIRAKGTMTLAGLVDAAGERIPAGQHSGNSGGGIWLLAEKIVAETTASLVADGATGATGYAFSGTGGRIALGIGLTDEQIEALAAGNAPADIPDVNSVDNITLVSASVQGGVEPKDKQGVEQRAPSGTLATVTGAAAEVIVTVIGTPVWPTGENGPVYGPAQCSPDMTVTFTATATASVPGEEDSVRYSLVGWVCSNETEQVAAGTGTTAQIPVGRQALTLSWIWGARQTRTAAVSFDETHGGVRVTGGTASGSADAWTDETANVTFEAVPADGGEFLYWVGDVPFGKALDASVVILGKSANRLTAVFRAKEAETNRVWVGAANAVGSWLDSTKWEPTGIPGRDDDVALYRGACEATNVVAVGSLTIGTNAIVRLAAKAANATVSVDAIDGYPNQYRNSTRPLEAPGIEEARLVVARDLRMTGKGQLTVGGKDQTYRSSLLVGGDLVLADTNRLCVVAGLTDETFTFARGAGFVTVGGKIEVGGASVIYPISEGYTGGSVVFRASHVVVGPEASFNAVNHGFRFYPDRAPYTLAPGLGWDFTCSAGYGGVGIDKNYNKVDFGHSYGFEFAPVHPGSCKGSYGSQERRGGGLIRLHARSVRIDGTLNARAVSGDKDESSCSGGGIWVTASGRLQLAPTAVLTAKGGYRIVGTSIPGAGGRIALASGVSDAQVDELAQTGVVSARNMDRWGVSQERFVTQFPGVTVDVRCGEEGFPAEHDGTFRYLRPEGFLIIVR